MRRRCWKPRTLIGLLLMAATLPVLAETPAEMRQRARELARQGQWQASVETYRTALAAEPDEPWTWFALGSVLHGMGDHQGAVDAWNNSLEQQVTVPAYVQYNLACGHARLGDESEALTNLQQAIASGLFSGESLEQDPDLESLRAVPAFTALVKAADQAHRPCLHSSEHRSLDFWIGEWDVRIPAGFLAARDVVTRSDDGCVVHQEWRGTLGSTGRSFTFYDPVREIWTQSWIGSNATVGTSEGRMVDGELQLEGPGGQPGTRVRTRWVRIDESRIDLITETSQDGGPWTLTSTLHYHRRTAS